MTEKKDKEIEASIIIYGESQKKIIKRLSGLKRIGKHYLSRETMQNIHDIYFDTGSNDLLEGGFGLRIRNINGKDKITLKGNSVRADWGGVQRMEIERNWEKQGWLDVFLHLQKNLAHLKCGEHFDDSLNAVSMLQQSGFKKIQERKNTRLIRYVFEDRNFENPIAELATDSLTFILKETEIYSSEIEVELKRNTKVDVLKSLMDELLVLFAEDAQVWEFSKLSTGRAMQQLWDKGILQKTLDKKKSLTQKSYNIIREFNLSEKRQKH